MILDHFNGFPFRFPNPSHKYSIKHPQSDQLHEIPTILQVLVSIVTIIITPPDVQLRMPVTTKKYVEMLCDLPISGLIAPLAYNMVLILSCSLYGFKARALPDNFNESKYIFLSVCTTIFLWLAFIPTYFTAFYATQKTLLLACILLLNPTVILLCLYIPKIYAIYLVDEDHMKISSTGTMVTTQGELY